MSKIIERVVKSRLTEHLSTNNLLNPHQSAYCKHNSTETSVYPQLRHQCHRLSKVSCLCLVDLSAAFDTNDDNLLSRLSSWFEKTGTVLDWFKSYLSSGPFHARCESSFSSLHTCFCGIPQGSVLGPILFIMYTTPLSSLISSLSLKHHLHANDTQLLLSLFLSSFRCTFQHNISPRRSAADFSWMTSNL